MARQIMAIALVFFAIINIMSTVNAGEPGPQLPTAAELGNAKGHIDVPEIPLHPQASDPAHPQASAPAHPQAAASAPAPSDDIGTTDGNDGAAPVGGPVAAGVFGAASPVGAPGASGASVVEFSIVGVTATIAAAFFF